MAHLRKRTNKRGETVWYVNVFLGFDANGKKLTKNVTVHSASKKEALRVAHDLEGQRSKGLLTHEKLTVSSLLDDVLTDYKVNGKDYGWAKGLVENYLRPTFGSIDPAKLDTAALRRWIATRQEVGASNSTINHGLSLLRRAYHLGYRATPPRVSRIPYFPMLKLNNTRRGFFEHSEYQALFDALPEELRPILAFGYYTGCRRGEILSLEWRQVDLSERIGRLDPGTTKNDEARTIPLAEPLYQILAMQKSVRDRYHPNCPWVFFRHASGERIQSFNKSWETACRKAGLWTGERKTGKPTKLFHDLRRTAVRNLIRAGAPEKVAMGISGHKTRAIFDRYNIVSERDLRSAAQRLGEYLAPKPPAATEDAIPKKFRNEPQTKAIQ